MDNTLVIKLLLTVILGAILGLETETRDLEAKGPKEAAKQEREKIGGLRTYTVISLLGGIAGILYISGSYLISYILLGAIILFVIVAYILNVQIKRAFGVTTEIAILITFVIGFLTTSSIVSVPVILVILVLLAFFLSQKRGLGPFISKIEHKEVIDIMKFGLISIVILPLLPNANYSIVDLLNIFNVNFNFDQPLLKEQLFNPFQLWLTVVVISGISLFAYTFSKFIGSKASLFISGILGGFISSTSTIAALSLRSKSVPKSKKLQLLLSGVGIMSNSVSLITLSILIFITSTSLLRELAPFILLLLISGVAIGVIIYLFLNKIKTSDSLELKYETFSIFPAVKFVLIILIVRIAVQILSSLNVNPILLIFLTSLSGLTGIDAPSVAIAGLFASKQISVELAVASIIITILINILGKMAYSYLFGNKTFFRYLTLGMLSTFLISVAILIL